MTATTTPRPEGARARLRLLVVDDEAIVRDSLGAWFRQEGHDVKTAESGREALRL
jgi:CheY-like chemotaxis protein